jgi:5-methylcytosine-specific restriction endonuclease McrA
VSGVYVGTRRKVYVRDNWTCRYCGAVPEPEHEGHPNKGMQLDHIVPRAKGGSNAASNLVVACCLCNSNKGARDVGEWAGAA